MAGCEQRALVNNSLTHRQPGGGSRRIDGGGGRRGGGRRGWNYTGWGGGKKGNIQVEAQAFLLSSSLASPLLPFSLHKQTVPVTQGHKTTHTHDSEGGRGVTGARFDGRKKTESLFQNILSKEAS
jgi:hypothetical protein